MFQFSLQYRIAAIFVIMYSATYCYKIPSAFSPCPMGEAVRYHRQDNGCILLPSSYFRISIK